MSHVHHARERWDAMMNAEQERNSMPEQYALPYSAMKSAVPNFPASVLLRCLRIDALREQVAPIRETVEQQGALLIEQQRQLLRQDLEVLEIASDVLNHAEPEDQYKERLRSLQDTMQSARSMLEETSGRFRAAQADLAHKQAELALEEDCLIHDVRASFSPNTVPEQHMMSSHSTSKDSSGYSEYQSVTSEVRAYYEAAGWVGIWNERIQDLRYQHAEELGQEEMNVERDGKVADEAAQAFESEECEMLQQLHIAKQKAKLLLQQCIAAGMQIPHRLPSSITISSSRSMSAISQRKDYASSPKDEFLSGSISSTPQQSPVFPAEAPLGDPDLVVPLRIEVDSQTRSDVAPSLGLAPQEEESLPPTLPNTSTEERRIQQESDPENIQGERQHSELLGEPYDSMLVDNALAQDGISESDENDMQGPLAESRRPIQTARWQENQGEFVQVRDPKNQLRLFMQTSPAELVTDPGLFREGISSRGLLLPTEGETEHLFENYRRRPKPREFFVEGRVFFTLWAEPSGDQSTTGVEAATQLGRYGERVFSKVRRFVVIREGRQYCSCLPIITYNNQGVAKAGVRKSDHAVVYTSKRPPTISAAEQPGDGEMGMPSASVRIDVSDPTDKLSDMSRLNYNAVYTIHHNIKVRNFGKVHLSSLRTLQDQFSSVIREHSSTSQTSGSLTRDRVSSLDMPARETSLERVDDSPREPHLQVHEDEAIGRMVARGFSRGQAIAAVRQATPQQAASATRLH